MDAKKYYDLVGKLGIEDSDFERFGFVYSHINPEKSIIDVGCGRGEWLKYLLDKTKSRLYGCDVSPVRLQRAKDLLNGEVNLFESDINNLMYRNNSFEQSTALEVIEHLPDWKKGIEELVRISSEKIVITVPYDENLKYQKCQNCGEDASLYGHFHSFGEEDFFYLKEKGLDVSFEKIDNPRNYSYYAKRLLNFILRKTNPETKSTNGHSSITICPSCYTEVPYTKYYERMRDRAIRLLTNTPEYLLVEIKK